MKIKDHFIHPEDSVNLVYWTKKWDISLRQLQDAILYTGSLNSIDIKHYLRKDMWYYFPVTGLLNLFKTKFNSIN